MLTQTAKPTTYEMDLIQSIGLLSDRAKLQARGYIERLRQEDIEHEAYEDEKRYQKMTLEEIDTEIASLEAKYGTTPNARTIAAMEEAEAGLCEKCTLEEAIAEINALA